MACVVRNSFTLVIAAAVAADDIPPPWRRSTWYDRHAKPVTGALAGTNTLALADMDRYVIYDVISLFPSTMGNLVSGAVSVPMVAAPEQHVAELLGNELKHYESVGNTR